MASENNVPNEIGSMPSMKRPEALEYMLAMKEETIVSLQGQLDAARQQTQKLEKELRGGREENESHDDVPIYRSIIGKQYEMISRTMDALYKARMDLTVQDLMHEVKRRKVVKREEKQTNVFFSNVLQQVKGRCSSRQDGIASLEKENQCLLRRLDKVIHIKKTRESFARRIIAAHRRSKASTEKRHARQHPDVQRLKQTIFDLRCALLQSQMKQVGFRRPLEGMTSQAWKEELEYVSKIYDIELNVHRTNYSQAAQDIIEMKNAMAELIREKENTVSLHHIAEVDYKNEIESLKGENANLAKEKDTFSQRIVALQDEVDRLAAADQDKLIEQLRGDLEDVSGKLEQSRQQWSELKESFDVTRHEYDIAISENDKASARIEHLKRELDGYVYRIERIQGEKTDLERQMNDMAKNQNQQGHLDSKVKELGSQLHAQVMRFAEMEGQYESASERVSELASALAKAEQQLESAYSRERESASLNEQLGDELRMKQEELSIAEAQLNTISQRNNVTSPQSDVSALKQTIRFLKKEKASLEGYVMQSNERLGKLQKSSGRYSGVLRLLAEHYTKWKQSRKDADLRELFQKLDCLI